MQRTRATITVEVDLDPFIGWGHEAHDFANLIERYLVTVAEHYNPVVTTTECGRCGGTATGLAKIDDTRYCHGDDDTSPTCYEQAVQEGST